MQTNIKIVMMNELYRTIERESDNLAHDSKLKHVCTTCLIEKLSRELFPSILKFIILIL